MGVPDGRAIKSIREVGRYAGYNGHKRKSDRKIHFTRDTLKYLFAVQMTPDHEQDATYLLGNRQRGVCGSEIHCNADTPIFKVGKRAIACAKEAPPLLLAK